MIKVCRSKGRDPQPIQTRNLCKSFLPGYFAVKTEHVVFISRAYVESIAPTSVWFAPVHTWKTFQSVKLLLKLRHKIYTFVTMKFLFFSLFKIFVFHAGLHWSSVKSLITSQISWEMRAYILFRQSICFSSTLKLQEPSTRLEGGERQGGQEVVSEGLKTPVLYATIGASL